MTAIARKAAARSGASTTATSSAKAAGSRAKLRVVDKAALRRRRRQRTVLSFLAVIVTAALFSVALLYGQIVEGQQDIDRLRAEIAQAEARRAQLEREVAVASTPEAIVQRAFQMGMVRAEDPQYLVAVRPMGSGE